MNTLSKSIKVYSMGQTVCFVHEEDKFTRGTRALNRLLASSCSHAEMFSILHFHSLS